MNWKPTASIENLKRRAAILQKIRDFFAERQVWEVETPLLASSTITDPNLHSARTTLNPPGLGEKTFYFQTSPEFHMKRLLAAGSGSIFQICKAVRDDELGKWHNPEFTMLEWYRLGFDHFQLMDEVDCFLREILNVPSADRLTYQSLFLKYCDLDPLATNPDELKACANRFDLSSDLDLSVDGWLQYLLSHIIEPQVGTTQPLFVYDFPQSQAALAKIRGNVAERFEIYFKGTELGNGFHELQDPNLQRQRFESENQARLGLGLPTIPLDQFFLAALDHGLPECSGIAIGVDRLIMYAIQEERLSSVIAFPSDIA